MIVAILALVWFVVTLAAFWFLVKKIGLNASEAMDILREMLELKRADVPLIGRNGDPVQTTPNQNGKDVNGSNVAPMKKPE